MSLCALLHMLCMCLDQASWEECRTPKIFESGDWLKGWSIQAQGWTWSSIVSPPRYQHEFALGTVELHWVYTGPFTNHVKVSLKCRVVLISADGVIQDVIGVQHKFATFREVTLTISSLQIKKKRGPNIEPWGTPDVTCVYSNIAPFTVIPWCLFAW